GPPQSAPVDDSGSETRQATPVLRSDSSTVGLRKTGTGEGGGKTPPIEPAPLSHPVPRVVPSAPPDLTHSTQLTQLTPSPVPLLNVPLRLVGVIGKRYVVLESDRGLVLLDQHAAHERILFEQMLERLEKAGQAPSQRLLLP